MAAKPLSEEFMNELSSLSKEFSAEVANLRKMREQVATEQDTVLQLVQELRAGKDKEGKLKQDTAAALSKALGPQPPNDCAPSQAKSRTVPVRTKHVDPLADATTTKPPPSPPKEHPKVESQSDAAKPSKADDDGAKKDKDAGFVLVESPSKQKAPSTPPPGAESGASDSGSSCDVVCICNVEVCTITGKAMGSVLDVPAGTLFHTLPTLLDLDPPQEGTEYYFLDENGVKPYNDDACVVATLANGTHDLVLGVRRTEQYKPSVLLYRAAETPRTQSADVMDIACGLWRDNFAVVDDFLMDRTLFENVVKEAAGLYESGSMHPGMISSGAARAPGGDEAQRWDQVCWAGDESTAIQAYVRTVHETMQGVAAFMSGRRAVVRCDAVSKAMVTAYPGRGTHYVMHVDNPDNDGRVLSAVLYLNQNWSAQDGGCLRIYAEAKTGAAPQPVVDIPPLANRLVVFWSDHRCPHEVRPTTALRQAIGVWFMDAVARAQAECGSHGERIADDRRRVASAAK